MSAGVSTERYLDFSENTVPHAGHQPGPNVEDAKAADTKQNQTEELLPADFGLSLSAWFICQAIILLSAAVAS